MRENEIYVYKRKKHFFNWLSMYQSYQTMPVHTHVVQAIKGGTMLWKNSMIDWKAEEDTSRLAVFANEHFDMWTDRMIKALVIFF
ncbi:hypothetical protein GCM10020331_063620 [Ectobacillus funiculus]